MIRKSRTRSLAVYPEIGSAIQPGVVGIHTPAVGSPTTRVTDANVDFTKTTYPLLRTSTITDTVFDKEAAPAGSTYFTSPDGKVTKGSPSFNPVTHNAYKLYVHNDKPKVVRRVGTTYVDEVTLTGIPFTAHSRYWRRPCDYVTGGYAGNLPNVSTITSALEGNVDAIYSFIKYNMLEDHKLLNFPDALSMLTFIGELKDIRQLVDFFVEHKFKQDYASDKFLGVNFGVIPLFKDIMAIIDRIYRLDDEISKWNQRAKKGKLMRVKAFLPIGALADNPTLVKSLDGKPVYGLDGSIRFVSPPIWKDYSSVTTSEYITGTCRTAFSGEVFAKGVVSVHFKPLLIDESLVAAVKSSLWGFKKPLTTVWELIPFSFIVDWFLDIQSKIDLFESEKPVLPMEIHSVGYSIKVKRIGHANNYYRTSHDKYNHGVGGCTEVHTFYKRVPLDPKKVLTAGKFYGPLEWSWLDGSQTILASALLHTALCRGSHEYRHL